MGQEILFCCIYKSVTFSFLSLVDFPVSCLNQFHLFKSSFYSPDLSWFLMQIEISLYLVFSLAFSCIRPCFPLLLSLTPPLPPPHPLLPPCLKRAFPQGRFPFPQWPYLIPELFAPDFYLNCIFLSVFVAVGQLTSIKGNEVVSVSLANSLWQHHAWHSKVLIKMGYISDNMHKGAIHMVDFATGDWDTFNVQVYQPCIYLWVMCWGLCNWKPLAGRKSACKQLTFVSQFECRKTKAKDCWGLLSSPSGAIFCYIHPWWKRRALSWVSLLSRQTLPMKITLVFYSSSSRKAAQSDLQWHL